MFYSLPKHIEANNEMQKTWKNFIVVSCFWIYHLISQLNIGFNISFIALLYNYV